MRPDALTSWCTVPQGQLRGAQPTPLASSPRRPAVHSPLAPLSANERAAMEPSPSLRASGARVYIRVIDAYEPMSESIVSQGAGRRRDIMAAPSPPR